MTEEEINGAIGSLIKRYSRNEELLVALKEKIGTIQRSIRLLGMSLDRPENTSPEEAGKVSAGMSNLGGFLTEYQEALECKKETEKLLDQAGLSNLIRS